MEWVKTEAVVRWYFPKKLFLEISENLQESTFVINLKLYLTHFMDSFYPLENVRKPSVFRMPSGGIERDQWDEIG